MRFLSQIDLSPLPGVSSTPATTRIIINTVFSILGGLCVIIIMFLSFRYIISRGNPEATGKLRDGIIYAAIGLAVIMAASAIVSFIVGKA